MMSQAGGMDVNTLIQRLRRLATLDTSVFDEVRTDPNSTIPAIAVAVVSTLLFGLGGWLWWVIAGPEFEGSDIFLKSFIIGSILSIILWGVWLGVTYVILTQVFRARADLNELVRVMGFAAAPLALGVLLFIPMLDFGIGLTVIALFFGSTLIAVQTATDAPAGRTLVAVGAGFAVWAIVLALFVGTENIYAPGFFVFDTGTEFLRDVGDFT
jgi:hypothetical protein